jgi:hypothetical protein
VWLPTLALWGYTLPSQAIGSDTMKVPGVNIIEAIKQGKDFTGSFLDTIQGKNAAGESNRLVTIQLCNFLYMPSALLEKAIPTFSTNVTESGFPLWAEVDCEVSTLMTADLTIINTMKAGLFADPNIVAALFSKNVGL